MTGRVALLEDRKLEPGTKGLAQIVLDEPINVCVGDRFVIRDQAALITLGGGSVIDPWSVKRGRARSERLQYLSQVRTESARDTLKLMVLNHGKGVDLDRFAMAFNLTASERETHINQITCRKLSENYAISEEHLSARRELSARLKQWHQKTQVNQATDQPDNEFKSTNTCNADRAAGR